MINEIEAWLYSRIKEALPEVGERIYPDAAEKGTANPCVIFQLMSGDPFQLLDCGGKKMCECVYQIRIYAARRMDANRLREELGAVINGCCTADLVGVNIEGVEYAGLQNTYDKDTEDYGALCAIRIHWKA